MERDRVYGNQGSLDGPMSKLDRLGEWEKNHSPMGRLVTLVPPQPPLLGRQVSTNPETSMELKTRDKPRLIFKPVHALTAILLLLMTLAASLTLLIQQSASLTNSVSEQARSSRSAGDQIRNSQSVTDPGGEVSRTPIPQSSTSTGSSPGHTEEPPREGSIQESGGSGDQVKIDINLAGLQDLQGVKGIGPVRAQRIVDYRERNGRFSSVDQLLEVSGIGPKTLDKLRPFLLVR